MVTRLMNVLMIAPKRTEGLYFGGIGVFAENLEKEYLLFKDNGVCFSVYNYFSGYKSLRGKKGFLKRVQMIKNYLNFYKMILIYLKNNKVDLIHYNTSRKYLLFVDSFIAKFISKKFKTKIIMQIHFAEYDKIFLQNRFLNYLVRKNLNSKMNKIILLSRTTEKEFVFNKFDSSKLKVLYNFHSFKKTNYFLEKKLDSLRHKEYIDLLFVGSIDKRKGLFVLLDILDKNKDLRFNVNICGMYSSEEMKVELEKYLVMNDRFKFHGYIDGEAKESIFEQSDILVLHSFGEGLPLVILEAMAFGCAIISTNVGAIPEIVKNNMGYINNPYKHEDLYNSLRIYDNNRKLLINHMSNSFENSKKFSINKYIPDISSIYKEVI